MNLRGCYRMSLAGQNTSRRDDTNKRHRIDTVDYDPDELEADLAGLVNRIHCNGKTNGYDNRLDRVHEISA